MRILCLAFLMSTFWTPLASAAIETFRLESGDVVSGDVLERNADRILLQHPIFGRLELPVAELAAPEAKPPEPPRRVDRGAFGSGWLIGWKRRIGLGFSGAEGSTKEANIDANLRFDFENEEKRWKIDSVYSFSNSDGETDKSQGHLQVNRDWLQSGSRWFQFANGRYEYDRFRAWNHRVGLVGGIGYDLHEGELWLLRGRQGGGGSYELDGEEDLRPEALVGIDSNWTISDRQKVEFVGELFPDLIDFGELRTRETLDWNIKIAEGSGLGLSFGVRHEYQSQSDDEPNELTYRGLVTYDF